MSFGCSVMLRRLVSQHMECIKLIFQGKHTRPANTRVWTYYGTTKQKGQSKNQKLIRPCAFAPCQKSSQLSCIIALCLMREETTAITEQACAVYLLRNCVLRLEVFTHKNKLSSTLRGCAGCICLPNFHHHHQLQTEQALIVAECLPTLCGGSEGTDQPEYNPCVAWEAAKVVLLSGLQ